MRLTQSTRLKPLSHALLAVLLLAVSLPGHSGFDRKTRKAVATAIEGEHRSEADRARDAYRKPAETLKFLGFRSDMTVVEVWPGSGWYTKILGPALAERGQLYAAHFSLNPANGFQRRGFGKFLSHLGEHPDLYRGVQITALEFPYDLRIAPPDSADIVLTFRNVHNWVMKLFGGGQYAPLAFTAMYDALKPGGILGIVDHRWPDPKTEDRLSSNGYISVERTIALAEAAGFKLVDQSELLANPADTHEHPRGVWTLPPSLALGDERRDHYLKIGESDRFLLKFQKPRVDD